MLTYGVCCSLRSGSTYLQELMAKNKLGSPGEDLHRYAGPATLQDRREYLKYLMDKAPPDQPFGLKLVKYVAQHWENAFEPDRLIWLKRTNLVHQAISMFLAKKTRQFRLRAGDKPAVPVEYDERHIVSLYFTLFDEQMYWRDRVKAFTGPKRIITYEDLAQHPDATIWSLSEFLEKPIPMQELDLNVDLRIQRYPELVADWSKRLEEPINQAHLQEAAENA